MVARYHLGLEARGANAKSVNGYDSLAIWDPTLKVGAFSGLSLIEGQQFAGVNLFCEQESPYRCYLKQQPTCGGLHQLL